MVLMNDWRKIALVELVTQCRDAVKIERGIEYRLLGVRWYGGGAFHRETVTRETSKATTLYKVTPGQFIYNRLFAGKGSFGIVLPEFSDAFVSNEFPLFDVNVKRLSVEYLSLYFQQGVIWGYVESVSTGTTASRSRWKESQFLKHRIPLPPLKLQEKIVEIIGAVDDQITALDAEAGALAAVLRRRRADLIADDSVEAVRAEYAFDFSTGVRRTPDRATGPHMTHYLRSANVGYGTLDLSDVLKMNYDPAEREKFSLRYGDVVISEGSASANAVGMPAMWRDELPAPVCTQMTLLRLRALEGVCLPEFAFHWSMWAYESRAFLDVAGGTNIKHISAKRAKEMAVRLPSLGRQREMAVELDAMQSALEALRAEALRLREVRAGMLMRLLDRTIDIESAQLEV
jgi:type I restriction enzyme S subunit